MPIVKLPNGQYANFVEGTPQEVIQGVVAQTPAHVPGQPLKVAVADDGTAVNPNEAEISKRVALNSKIRANTAGDTGHSLMGGLLGSFNDEVLGGVSAATRGSFNALRKGDVGEIGKEYNIARSVVQREQGAEHESSPVGSTMSEIAGALLNPIGRGIAGAGKLGTAFAKAPGIVQGVGVGAAQGALNAAGASDGADRLGAAAGGALEGGAMGGGIGALAHGGQKIVQAISDHQPQNAARKAYDQIAELLHSGKVSPEKVERDIKVAGRMGVDQRVMDATPGLQAVAAATSRRPGITGSGDLIATGENRMAGRRQNFVDQIQTGAKPATGQDAMVLQAANTGARKQHGNASYEAVLDKPMVWNDKLADFVHGAGPSTKSAIKHAENLMRDERLDPNTLGLRFGKDGELVKFEKPTMRTFDYIKRGFDGEMGIAVRAGDRNKARILSNELTLLKEGVGDANPQYKNVLATQHDYFQKDAAVEFGKEAMGRIANEPRAVLEDMKAIDPNHREYMRTGIVDSLLDMRNARADPVARLRNMLAAPDQRRVLEHVFDGKANLSRFELWIKKESRVAKTDQMVSGKQSITSTVAGAEKDALTGMSDMALAGSGLASGNYGMAARGGILFIANKLKGVSPAAQEELAKILNGKGEGLASKIKAGEGFRVNRDLANKSRVRGAAKAGQQLPTGALGGQQDAY